MTYNPDKSKTPQQIRQEIIDMEVDQNLREYISKYASVQGVHDLGEEDGFDRVYWFSFDKRQPRSLK